MPKQARAKYTLGGFTMKYMCLIYSDESGMASATEEQINQVMTAYYAFS